jgi:transcriptional regulator with XRE-family HTH domain
MMKAITADEILIGNRIKQARIEAGFSQSALGKELGVSFQQIQKYERGKNRVSLSRAEKISEILGKPPLWLLSSIDDAGTKMDLDISAFIASKQGGELARIFPSLPDHERVYVLEFARRLAAMYKIPATHPATQENELA